MIYRITVDGKRKYAEASIREYSLETDNLAREEIIRHYLDEENATEVLFDTTLKEAREIAMCDKNKGPSEYWVIEE